MNKAIRTTLTFAFAIVACIFAATPAYAMQMEAECTESVATAQSEDSQEVLTVAEDTPSPEANDPEPTDEGAAGVNEKAVPGNEGTVPAEEGAVPANEDAVSDSSASLKAENEGTAPTQGSVTSSTSADIAQVEEKAEQPAEIAATASTNNAIAMKTATKKSGWVQENGKTHYYVNNKIQTGWAVTDSYKNYGLQRYWLGAYGDLVTSKIVNYNRAGSLTYCTSAGYVARNKYKETDGKLYLANNDGKLENTGWLVTGEYDGGVMHRYYVNESTHSAKLGFFKVANKQYYGYTDRGYVLHGDYDYLEGHWYTANNDGVLTNADSRFSRIETYVKWMLGIAADDSHGYDQTYRWGERGDYDCSSLVISAVRAAGIDTKWATYTGNMRSAFTSTGFYCRGFDNLKRGDILLNDTYHVAIYIGNGQLVHASGNEWGGATGGQPGDQTGKEICVRSYYNRPWNTVLRWRC